MKQNMTFCLLLLMFCSAKAQRNIFPILADSPKWCMLTTAYNGGNPNNFYYPYDYFYQKDTVVDGKTYSKLRPTQYLFQYAFGALIRNEGRKTYIRRVIPNQTPITYSKEKLLYNFDMKSTKDSFFAPAIYSSRSNQVDSIIVKFLYADTIVFNGVSRRHIKVEYRTKDDRYRPLRPSQADWVEGFGSYENPFYDLIFEYDGWVNVMGLDLNGLREYENHAIAHGCSPIRSGVYDPLLTNIKVYPNPVAQKLSMDIPTSTQLMEVDVVLHDLLGKTVFMEHLPILNSPLSIDVSYLKGGIYILSLQSRRQQLFSQKILKIGD